jgi:hypothetical protein
LAALSNEPMRSKSVAAEASISGTATTYDIAVLQPAHRPRSRRLVDIISPRAQEPLYRTYELRLLTAATSVDQ